MKKQGRAVAMLLAGIAAAGFVLTALTHTQRQDGDDLRITAAFYPMYTAALQVVGDVEGVSVSCLTAPTAGCVHDYQLSPDEMVALSKTDLLILNGAGAETFLAHALERHSQLKTVDTSVGVALLEGCHDHDHEGHHHAHNEHSWLSPDRYYKQVENLRDGLCEADPVHAEAYARNADAYLERIAAVAEQMREVAATGWETVLFHDSVAYPAADLSLRVVAELPLSENTALSAHELAEAAEAVRGKAVILLYDEQFVGGPSLSEYAADVRRVMWDAAVRPKEGIADRDRWLAAMARNLQQIKEATRS